MCACELNCPRAAKVIMWKACKIKIFLSLSLSLSLSFSLGSVSGMNTGQSVLSSPKPLCRTAARSNWRPSGFFSEYRYRTCLRPVPPPRKLPWRLAWQTL